MKHDFSNTNSLIIGGSSGIGFQISKDLSKFGSKPIIVSHNEKKIINAIKKIPNCSYFISDLSKYDECLKLCHQVNNEKINLDFLVFSVGEFKYSLIDEITEEEWNNSINLNLKSIFFLIKFLIPPLVKGKGKSIVLISSILSLFASRGTTIYSVSKAGLVSLTRSLSLELAKYQIRINCISPSYVKTEMIKSLIADKESYLNILTKHPMNRIGTVRDISNLTLFLLDSSSSWLTGQNIIIDGGRSVTI